jgi:hypothetical protein
VFRQGQGGGVMWCTMCDVRSVLLSALSPSYAEHRAATSAARPSRPRFAAAPPTSSRSYWNWGSRARRFCFNGPPRTAAKSKTHPPAIRLFIS